MGTDLDAIKYVCHQFRPLPLETEDLDVEFPLFDHHVRVEGDHEDEHHEPRYTGGADHAPQKVDPQGQLQGTGHQGPGVGERVLYPLAVHRHQVHDLTQRAVLPGGGAQGQCLAGKVNSVYGGFRERDPWATS